MTEYKRKLIEVALPLEAINKESAREKSIRHGHPSTLHLWWARRPLATCRAVLFASLVDDPSAHPEEFPTEALQQAERLRLFAIIEELVTWENRNNERVLAAARAEIIRSCDGHLPAVLDPFCGGGSIPLEAQRLGLKSYASDLNPVAVLITKALVEIPSRFAGRPPINPSTEARGLGAWARAHGLSEDVRYYGRWMREEAHRRIGKSYPKVDLPPEHGGGDATVIAWIWARTVKCPNPACGAEMPLISSMSLSTKPGHESWLEPIVDRTARTVAFAIGSPPGSPGAAPKLGRGANFKCLVCQTDAPEPYVKAEGVAGRMGSRLIAIVADGPNGRVYLPANREHEQASRVTPGWRPEAKMPENPRWFSPPSFGFITFGDLFSDRQLVALVTFADEVGEARKRALADAIVAGLPDDGIRLADGGAGATGYADAIATYLAFAVSRGADYWSTISTWASSGEFVRDTFARQAIPMTWDFAEVNPFSSSTGNVIGALNWIEAVLAELPTGVEAEVKQLNATAVKGSGPVMVSTDPPYYDNIGYADLADYFYVWLRRSLGDIFPTEFSTLLVPKSDELVATPYRFGGSKAKADKHFEAGLSAAFARMLEAHAPSYPLTVYYAFKQAEDDGEAGGVASTGWETMLEALTREGFTVQGTWPVRSERGGRMISLGTNALASSIVLVCRPRSASAPLATRKDFSAALQAELPGALRRLQQGYIAPVDLAQAAIGPGMAVFSRYAKVIEADGSPMSIRTALGLINRVLDQTLAEQEGDFDANTRWAVAWFEQFGMNPGDFGVAETLSKAKNSAVNALVDAEIVVARGGKVRLRGRDELSADWDPAADGRLTVWEVTQHLIRALESGGEIKAAELVWRVGGLSETARELAYRLYNICERKRWAKDALSYNGLVVAWPGILRAAAEQSGQGVQLSLGS